MVARRKEVEHPDIRQEVVDFLRHREFGGESKSVLEDFAPEVQTMVLEEAAREAQNVLAYLEVLVQIPETRKRLKLLLQAIDEAD